MADRKKKSGREVTYQALKNIAGITALPVLMHMSGLIVSKTGRQHYVHLFKTLFVIDFKDFNPIRDIRACITECAYNFNMAGPWLRFLKYSLILYLVFEAIPCGVFILDIIQTGINRIKDLICKAVKRVRKIGKKDIADMIRGMIYGIIPEKPKGITHIGIEINTGVKTYYTGGKIEDMVTVLSNPKSYSPNFKNISTDLRLIFINAKKHIYIAGENMKDERKMKRRKIPLKKITVVYTEGKRIVIRKFSEE